MASGGVALCNGMYLNLDRFEETSPLGLASDPDKRVLTKTKSGLTLTALYLYFIKEFEIRRILLRNYIRNTRWYLPGGEIGHPELQ